MEQIIGNIKLVQRPNADSFDLFWDNNVSIGYVYKEVDGYYGWVAPANNNGYWDSYALKQIVNVLDKLNEPWNNELKAYEEEQRKQFPDKNQVEDVEFDS